MRSDSTRAEPAAIVQPSVPCPVLSQRPATGVRPTTGVPSGVIGRRPVQKLARDRSPAPPKRSFTDMASVSRRAGGRVALKPATSAMPPTRIRVPSRVIAIL